MSMQNLKKSEVGMVFGVFDGLHHGHKYFLSVAAEKCEKLIVVVTRPEIVYALKGHTPKHTFRERVNKIRAFNSKIITIPGDKKLGEWKVLKDHRPDIVFLGFDQNNIARELGKLDIPFEFIDFYKQ